jgi:hypothetical protein
VFYPYLKKARFAPAPYVHGTVARRDVAKPDGEAIWSGELGPVRYFAVFYPTSFRSAGAGWGPLAVTATLADFFQEE